MEKLEIKNRMIGDAEWVSPKNGEFKLISMDESNQRAFYLRKLHQYEGRGKNKHIIYTTVMLEIVRWTDGRKTYPSDSEFGERGFCVPVSRLKALKEYYREKYKIPSEVFELLICAS